MNEFDFQKVSKKHSAFSFIQHYLNEEEQSRHLTVQISAACGIGHGRNNETIIYMGTKGLEKIREFESAMVEKYWEKLTEDVREYCKRIPENKRESMVVILSAAGSLVQLPVLKDAPLSQSDFLVWLKTAGNRPIPPTEPVTWPEKYSDDLIVGPLNAKELLEPDIDQNEMREKEKRGELFFRPKGRKGGFRSKSAKQNAKSKKKRRRSNK